ncbi:putative serine protease, trypsin domain, peptidase S1A, chymotrypsin family, peptidase S1, PA clan [Septoria linicola]|nr:putative serine protease, trypsin domain, peptidase S1A, chymotrypsin family, peptidase S1, PA clan [Septoria linicola]
MSFLLLTSLLTSMVSALPASTLANDTMTEIIWDTNSAIDIDSGPSPRDETGPAKEDLEPDNSIVGGYRARQGEFPTTISLRNFGAHVCGASLINSNTALTAAHCVDMGGSFSVAAGTNSWQFGGARSSVSQIIIHSGYVAETFDNDFAILKLTTRIPQTGLITYARLPPAGSDPDHNTPAVVAGW